MVKEKLVQVRVQRTCPKKTKPATPQMVTRVSCMANFLVGAIGFDPVLTVNSVGSGQAAFPDRDSEYARRTATEPAVTACQNIGGSGNGATCDRADPGTNTGANLTLFEHNGTPAAGQSYIFLCRG